MFFDDLGTLVNQTMIYLRCSIFILLTSGLVSKLLYAAPLNEELVFAMQSLDGIRTSAETRTKVIEYARTSNSATATRALSLLLKKEREQRNNLRWARSVIRSLRIDGRKKDWLRTGLIKEDTLNDPAAIDKEKSSSIPSPTDDLKSHAFIMDDDNAYMMVEPSAMPKKGQSYHYRINLLNSDWNIIYAIVWTDTGSGIQEWNGKGNFLKFISLPRSSVRRGKVFEAKVPTRMLKRLPYEFGLQSVAWQSFKNLYDVNLDSITQPVTELYKSTSLELFLRYADRIDLPSNDPFAAAQAITDAYIYKRATKTLKSQVIQDGIKMIEYGRKLGESIFKGQESLARMDLEQILSWSNRAIVYGDYYGIDYYVAAHRRMNEKSYQFMVLKPETLYACKRIVENNNLLDPSSLVNSASNINHWLWDRIKYRRHNLSDIEKMLADDPDNPWLRQIFEESLYEKEHNLVNVAIVNGVEINKGNIFSSSFQIDYLLQNGMFYGNCVDVVAMEAACLKAYGIPGIHVYYGLLSQEEKEFKGYHSIWMYYGSQRDRWINFEKNESELGNVAIDLSLNPLTVVWHLDKPQIGAYWRSYQVPFLGIIEYVTPRTVYASMSEGEWSSIYTQGLSNEAVKNSFGLQ
ncbi:MAG: hypothetical protein GYA55_01400 [SAR324 cluster bacterium]|uniref:Uncharacterized protein n=1 Tax=SAR324 cluster bacterium TaxID=2024889 RepID=A0A7X9FPA5_9DELT|nr:hypothetical protein [SAR324 cluster bacterium]